MAKRLVLFGDGLISPNHGFGEILLDHVLLSSPGLSWQFSIQSSEEMTLERAFQEASWRIIGKAPQELVLAFGATEIQMGLPAQAIFPRLQDLIHLLQAKTQAKIALVALPEAFFEAGSQRDVAQDYNQALLSLTSPNLVVLDVNPAIEAFLVAHRDSPGEKRALHLAANRLTSLGRLLMAQALIRVWPWQLM